MAGRYPFWHARRGDVNASPALRDLGKKLLGEIAVDQERGGPPTQVRRQGLPDGSSVEARMVHGTPSLTFYPPRRGPGGEPVATYLEGFVVLPHEHGLTEPPAGFNEVVVPRPGAQRPKPPLYADAAAAAAITHPEVTKWLPYLTNEAALPEFTEGLTLAGNVDWRNADETLSVSWFGANSRYFPDEGEHGTAVYMRGRQLFDLFDPPAEAVPDLVPFTGRRVYGAALRRENGWWLLVACSMATASGDTDMLLRVPVRVDPTAPAWQHRAGVEFAPLVATVPAQAEILWSAARTAHDATHDGSFLHPWAFNGPATQAKRLYRSNTTDGTLFPCMVEETLELEDLTAITRSRLEHKMLRTRVHSLRDVILNPNPAFTYQFEGDPTVHTVTGEWRQESIPIANIPDYCGVVQATASLRETTVPVVVAVDYRGTEPVYARWQNGDQSVDSSLLWDDSSPAPVRWNTSYSAPDNYVYEESHDVAGTFTSSYTSSTLAGRLILPETVIELSATHSITTDRQYAYVSTREVTQTPSSYSESGSGSASWNVNAFTQSRVDARLMPLFLDLRSGLCVVYKSRLTATRTGTPYANSTSTLVNDPPGSTTWVSQTQTAASNSDLTRTLRLDLDTEVHLKDVLLHATSATTVGNPTTINGVIDNGIGLFVFGLGQYPVERMRTSLSLEGGDPTWMEATSPYTWTKANITYPWSVFEVFFPDLIPRLYELPNADTTTAMTTGFPLPLSPASLSGHASQVGANVSWIYEEPWKGRPDMRSYGSWATLRGSYAVSMPWPTDAVSLSAYLNVVDGFTLYDATGQDSTGFSPVWTLTATGYVRRRA